MVSLPSTLIFEAVSALGVFIFEALLLQLMNVVLLGSLRPVVWTDPLGSTISCLLQAGTCSLAVVAKSIVLSGFCQQRKQRSVL